LLSLPRSFSSIYHQQPEPSLLGKPLIGWGCQSLTFVCYAACQLLLVLLFLAKSSCPAWYTTSVFCVLTFLSLFFSLAGTLLQVIGVYRNCFCYINADMWLKPEPAFVNVASDTQEQRDSSSNWIIFGGTATFLWAYAVISAGGI
jgi:hypothetical protein